MSLENATSEAWKSFMERGEVKSSLIPAYILQSWKRCRELGLDPFARNMPRGRDLRSLENENDLLLRCALPTVELLNELIRGSSFIVVLTDCHGYILRIVGDAEVVEMARANNLVPGADRSEEAVGTNAIGLAVKMGKPVQIAGPEHYNVYHHRWTCSAAPIYTTSKKLIGIINFSGPSSLVHKHTLGMAAAAAKSIERELALQEKTTMLSENNQYLNAILESVSDGILATDQKGCIVRVNSVTARLCNCGPDDLVGKDIRALFKSHSPERLFVEARNKEVYYFDPKTKKRLFFMIDANPITHDSLSHQGAVIRIRKRSDVHRLAHNIFGGATFTFSDIIGQDPEFLEAVAVARAAARFDCKILLHGETGTGKEVFAQAIHNASPRKNEPFIAVNCGAIPRELVESELFGYEEGAFTGSRRGGKPGKFELADGGTLFLDEIGTMPLDIQAKLLRVMQDGRVTRLGGSDFLEVNVRVIAATNEDLEQKVSLGEFRADLFYRLSVITVRIPPLRRRPSDILLLVEHLSEKIARRLNKKKPKFTKSAVDALLAYDWPGNVRELENVIERTIILCEHESISVLDLPQQIRQLNTRAQKRTDPLSNEHEEKAGSYLAEAEKKAIIDALMATGGNITRAARLLGITRNTLYKKLKSYDISFSS
ncbi:MAG: sigma-54-dependent Fis family transcriptional regulator [Clostridia bacterium]|nr:sigma-54-dependent Fis family transcriptional regulator [Clostridia bacterium]